MEYWLWLQLVEGIGSITERKLLQYFGNPKSIYEADQEQLRLVEGIGPKLAANIRNFRSLDQALRLQENIFKQGISILTIHDANYPQQLLQYPLAPTILYYKGKLRDSLSGVAVVGARRCSTYGKQVTLDPQRASRVDASNYRYGGSHVRIPSRYEATPRVFS